LRIILFTIGLILSVSAHADSPWTFTDEYSIPLAEGARERLQTDYYELGQWNVLTGMTKEKHGEWIYGGKVNGPGTYNIDAHKAGVGDFNGDSAQDMLINWTIFPNLSSRAPVAPSVLINRDGELELSSEIWATEPPSRMVSYKVGVADFNLDGSDDVVLGSFGIGEELPDGTENWVPERISLLISENGQLADYSDQIEGQENSPLASFGFAHDLAVGDVNGDGNQDFYQGRHLFIGDGTGRFTFRDDLAPVEAGIGVHSSWAMSSAIGDLDNDGVDDLVIGLADGQPPEVALSGWIFLSDGANDLSNARKIPLPDGRYGLLNTKHNSMEIADVTGNGWNDILIGQTKADPYYEGRQLQLLANKGGGVFVDETDLRLSEGIRLNAHGEGITFIMDINGDGYVDIVDSAGAGPKDVGLLVNNGLGFFERIPMTELPIVQNYHFEGLEDWEGFDYGTSQTLQIYPIDLDGDGIASFVVQVNVPAEFAPNDGDYDLTRLYTIRPTMPFKPVANQEPQVPEILGALSGSWFDPTRNGEGFVLDFSKNLSGPVATVYWFTHRNGKPYWLIGTTEYDSDEFYASGLLKFDLFEVSGTGFGDEFDANELRQTLRGSISFLFNGCDHAVASWEAENSSDFFESPTLAYDLERITLGLDGVPCRSDSVSQQSKKDRRQSMAGVLSGSWYDPARDGEGLVFEFAQNNSGPIATGYWFTHRDGQPYWMIGTSEYEREENALDLEFLEVSGTGFGDNFDPSAVRTKPWGHGSFSFINCSNALAGWKALNGEEGELSLKRITLSLDGVECESESE